MDLNLTAEESTFRDELRTWLISNAPKNWSEWREKPIEESYSAGWALEENAPDARAAVSIAKMYAGDAARAAGNRGIQIHGGMGFTWENDLRLYYRRAKASETAFGDATFHRERIASTVIDAG